MTGALTVVLAMALDALFGEPKWLWDRLPHPAVLMGRLIGWADGRFNAGSDRRAKGIVLMLALIAGAWALGCALAQGGWLVEALIAAMLLAQKSLVQHVDAVARGLKLSLSEGKRQVAMIVGRDTQQMDSPAVARSAIESAAENLSDGVVAPLFWFLVAGLPGLLTYKIINTADSMIGYLTPRHGAFGWAAAKIDDVVNWVPARLTAVLILLAHMRPDLWEALRRDAPLHRSPNAGWPEAAMAHVHHIALSGPRAYDGEMRDFPFVNPAGRRALTAQDITAAVATLWRVWGLMFAGAVILTLL